MQTATVATGRTGVGEGTLELAFADTDSGQGTSPPPQPRHRDMLKLTSTLHTNPLKVFIPEVRKNGECRRAAVAHSFAAAPTVVLSAEQVELQSAHCALLRVQTLPGWPFRFFQLLRPDEVGVQTVELQHTVEVFQL